MMITVVPGLTISSNTNDGILSDNDAVIIIITAVAGIPLFIAIVLFFVILSLCRTKKKCRKEYVNGNNTTIIKPPSQSEVPNNGHNPQQCTQDNADQPSHDHSNNNASLQETESDLAFTDDTFYLPTKSISLDSILEHCNDMLAPSVDYDVIITPNPPYTVTVEGRTVSEEQYDCIQTDDMLVQHEEFGNLKLVGSAASDGVYDKATNPTAGDDYVSTDLNPSYDVPQDDQDVKLEDNPPYM